MGILDEDVARVRDATDLVALASEHLALEAGRAQLRRPLPVPHREVAVVQRSTPKPGGSNVSVATRAVTRSRSCATSSTSTSSTRSSGLRREPASHCATTTRTSPRTARGSSGYPRPWPPRSRSTTTSCWGPSDAGIARRLPALARVRRRRGAPVPARVLTRRLGPAQRVPAAEEVRARRHRGRRARVREQGEQAAGPVPRSRHVPDLRPAGRRRRLRWAGARRRATRSTRTRPKRRSTRRADCSTGSTGRRARSSAVVRW